MNQETPFHVKVRSPTIKNPTDEPCVIQTPPTFLRSWIHIIARRTTRKIVHLSLMKSNPAPITVTVVIDGASDKMIKNCSGVKWRLNLDLGEVENTPETEITISGRIIWHSFYHERTPAPNPDAHKNSAKRYCGNSSSANQHLTPTVATNTLLEPQSNASHGNYPHDESMIIQHWQGVQGAAVRPQDSVTSFVPTQPLTPFVVVPPSSTPIGFRPTTFRTQFDVLISVGDWHMPANRSIVSNHSRALKSLLEKNESNIYVENISSGCMWRILNYISDPTQYEWDTMDTCEILAAADRLEMTEIKDLCTRLLATCLNSMSILPILKIAYSSKVDALIDSCWAFLLKNRVVFGTDDFKKICKMNKDVMDRAMAQLQVEHTNHNIN